MAFIEGPRNVFEDAVIRHIQNLSPKPGDIVVISHPDSISQADRANLLGCLERLLKGYPASVRFMLVPETVKVETVERVKHEPAPEWGKPMPLREAIQKMQDEAMKDTRPLVMPHGPELVSPEEYRRRTSPVHFDTDPDNPVVSNTLCGRSATAKEKVTCKQCQQRLRDMYGVFGVFRIDMASGPDQSVKAQIEQPPTSPEPPARKINFREFLG